MHACWTLLHKGLDQHDLAPRNVIVTPAPVSNDPDPVVERVTLIDYAHSIVFPLSTRKQHPHQKVALPQNPIEYFRGGAGMQFDGWVSDLYPCYEQWLQETFGRKEKAAEYAPVIYRPAAQGPLHNQSTIRPGSSSGNALPAASSAARTTAPASAQTGQSKKSDSLQPVQANNVNATKNAVVPVKDVAPAPRFSDLSGYGFKLWEPVEFLDTKLAVKKP